MTELHDESIGLIVTSPPYWDLKDYSEDSQIGLGQSYKEYLVELGKVLAECVRVLQPGRFFALVIGTRVSDGDLKHIPRDVIGLLNDLGMTLKKEIIWVKPKGTQGLWQRGTTQYLKRKPYPGCANINIQHEFILIFQKPGEFPVRKDMALAADFIKEVSWSVWELPVSKVKGHPAPFPKEIPRRLIQMFSYPDDLILDPFLGSGTTCLAAAELGRRSVGYEISPEFCRMAAEALSKLEGPLLEGLAATEEIPGVDEETDWEFVGADTRYATHDFHRYSSKFIPQIANRLLMRYSSPGETVLDVFCGSGTTLVEAKMLGRNVIGLDLNPLAWLISKVKVTNLPEEKLRLASGPFLAGLERHINVVRIGRKSYQLALWDDLGEESGPFLPAPCFPNADQWFQPQVIQELLTITAHIRRVGDTDLQDFLICALSAILRTVSNAASGFGNLMIDKSKRRITDTFERFRRQVMAMCEGMREFNVRCSWSSAKAQVILGDARNLNFLANDAVDLIVTHPPYIAAVPYAEYQKLSLNWLGEYFQERFPSEAVPSLQPRHLDRQIIGGQRSQKDVVERYRTDMAVVFREMFRVLKPGRVCCVVIGNPVVKGQTVPLNLEFRQMARAAGFRFEEEIVRGKYQTTMGKMKEEYILIFRKLSPALSRGVA